MTEFKISFNTGNAVKMNELELDIESFIKEIEKRPALWNLSCEEYKDRQAKKTIWREVCESVVPEFNEKTDEEQTQIERTIQVKWKNVRDCYTRSLRGRKMRRGTQPNKHKPYIYAKLLEFLSIDSETCCPRDSLIKRRRLEESFDVKEESPYDDFEETQTEYIETPIEMGCKNGKQVMEDPFVDTMDSQDQNSYLEQSQLRGDDSSNSQLENQIKSKENDDAAFFRSLAPMLQTLSSHQKISFRIDVMKLLSTYIKPDKS